MDMHDLYIPEQDWRKLLAAASGDAALLYLYIRAGGQTEQAESALRMSQPRMDCAAACLKQLGLWPEAPKILRPAEPPVYSEEDLIREQAYLDEEAREEGMKRWRIWDRPLLWQMIFLPAKRSV